MNLHPIIVHFPIALLVLYTSLEVVSFFKKSRAEKLSFTKIFLLVVGIVWTFFALQSGEVAQDLLWKSDLIHQHEEFAEMTYKTYLIILLIYIITRETVLIKFKNPILSKISTFVAYLKTYGVVVLLSVIWLVLLTIVWALWGAISHGPAVDPIVQYIYTLVMWG
jgi:uncharacterized membrane protein